VPNYAGVLDSAAKNSEAEKNPSLKQENAFSNWGGNKYKGRLQSL
jgi:hypothetical protein